MVSKASEDFPEPESPVITTSRSRGISRSMFLRLCSRAPLMTILSATGDARNLIERLDVMVLDEVLVDELPEVLLRLGVGKLVANLVLNCGEGLRSDRVVLFDLQNMESMAGPDQLRDFSGL